VPGVLYEPQRIYPKGVHKQVKADGRVKEREVTDYAAAREQHHLKLPRLFKNRPTHPSKSMEKGGRSKDRNPG
jgi:hypothetical protein